MRTRWQSFYPPLLRTTPLQFSQLEAKPDATPKVLSRRLTELVDAGLVSRTSYDEIPPRVEYEPTPKADALDPVFQFLYA